MLCTFMTCRLTDSDDVLAHMHVYNIRSSVSCVSYVAHS